jgi:toxin ParE1/3/4
VAKPVRLRRRAADDVEAAISRYLDEAGPEIAGRFIDAVERGLQRIGRRPHSGSLRFAYELDLPELRVWPLARFPYLVFYVERQHEIDVWRVLHSRRDLPVPLVGDNDEE